MRIGVLGGGQLGMMLARAGVPLGMQFRFLDPASDAPARDHGEHIVAAYEDIEAVAEFAKGLDAVTYEFESVPFETVRWLAERLPVAPAPDALHTAQDRLFEKRFLTAEQIPSPPYADFFFRDEYEAALRHIGLPAVLKTRRFGYDGKGQRVLRDEASAAAAWKELHGIPLFLEGFVPFDRELSVIAVGRRGARPLFYPLTENHHREGILRVSIAPAPGLSEGLQWQAEHHAGRVLAALGYVGVLAIEFFDTGGTLLANEMAPRVHNSGHWTMDAATTSQFASHLRALADLPATPVDALGVCAMVNLVGTLPDLGAVSAVPGTHVHLYNKSPRRGRKLGHVNIRRARHAELREPLERVLALLPEDGRFDYAFGF